MVCKLKKLRVATPLLIINQWQKPSSQLVQPLKSSVSGGYFYPDGPPPSGVSLKRLIALCRGASSIEGAAATPVQMVAVLNAAALQITVHLFIAIYSETRWIPVYGRSYRLYYLKFCLAFKLQIPNAIQLYLYSDAAFGVSQGYICI